MKTPPPDPRLETPPPPTETIPASPPPPPTSMERAEEMAEALEACLCTHIPDEAKHPGDWHSHNCPRYRKHIPFRLLDGKA